MSLKQVLEFFNKNKFDILSMGVFFGILGMVIYFLFPAKYLATGYIYVSRNIEEREYVESLKSDFSYEGFYAQQNAAQYTGTVLGLIESENLHYTVLEDLGVNPNTKNLRKLARTINVKKVAPQLIEITVKEMDQKKAIRTWNTVSEVLYTTTTRLNQEGDPNLKINIVENSPVLLTTIHNPFINIVAGLFIGTFVATFVLALEEYLITNLDIKSRRKK